MYKNVATLLEAAKNSSLYRAIMEDELRESGKSESEVREALALRLDVMRKSVSRALGCPQEMSGGLISGQSRTQSAFGGKLSGGFINLIMSHALSASEVNASMGVICAAPTAGSCGVLPAVLLSVSEMLGSDEDELIAALAVAGGFGAIITKNATVSGAEGGCQAECGAAAAMAAAACVYLAKGSGEQCAEAVSIALSNCMGLICDPVAGLVQLPCSFRNASQAVNAVVSADMALAGQTLRIPADEVIEAMYRTGRQLPTELKETALGGIAATPTAKELERKLQS